MSKDTSKYVDSNNKRKYIRYKELYVKEIKVGDNVRPLIFNGSNRRAFQKVTSIKKVGHSYRVTVMVDNTKRLSTFKCGEYRKMEKLISVITK